MAYEGEKLDYCPTDMFDFDKTYAVLVSGAKLNPYGHMLLNSGGQGGKYFHVSDIYGVPRFMDEDQFQRYLSDNNKVIVMVLPQSLQNPAKAQLKLEEILSRKWIWGVVVHNCETLVEEIVIAGGGSPIYTGDFALPMKSTNQCSPW